MKTKQIKFCPKCKSTNWIFLTPLGKAISPMTKCKNCSYVGNFPEIKENKWQKLKLTHLREFRGKMIYK